MAISLPDSLVHESTEALRRPGASSNGARSPEQIYRWIYPIERKPLGELNADLRLTHREWFTQKSGEASLAYVEDVHSILNQ